MHRQSVWGRTLIPSSSRSSLTNAASGRSLVFTCVKGLPSETPPQQVATLCGHAEGTCCLLLERVCNYLVETWVSS